MRVRDCVYLRWSGMQWNFLDSLGSSSSERSIGSDEWKDLCYAQLNKSDSAPLYFLFLYLFPYTPPDSSIRVKLGGGGAEREREKDLRVAKKKMENSGGKGLINAFIESSRNNCP